MNGKQHDKDWLIRKLQSACEEPFQAVDVSVKTSLGLAYLYNFTKITKFTALEMLTQDPKINKL